MAADRSLRQLTWLIVAILLFTACEGQVQACPTCKDSIAASSNSMNLVQGYGWSIIFMMSAPFLILFSLGTYFYLLVRRAARNPELYAQHRPQAALSEVRG